MNDVPAGLMHLTLSADLAERQMLIILLDDCISVISYIIFTLHCCIWNRKSYALKHDQNGHVTTGRSIGCIKLVEVIYCDIGGASHGKGRLIFLLNVASTKMYSFVVYFFLTSFYFPTWVWGIQQFFRNLYCPICFGDAIAFVAPPSLPNCTLVSAIQCTWLSK